MNEIRISNLKKIFLEIYTGNKFSEDARLTEIGFNSISAIKMIAIIRKEYGVVIPIKTFFAKIKIKDLFIKIDELIESKNKENVITIAKSSSDDDTYPATIAQKALYFVLNKEKNDKSYNITMVMEIKGELDIEKINDCFKCLVKKHSSLRTGFLLVDNKIIQKIYPSVNFEVGCTDVNEEELKDTIDKFIQPFDLEKPPLIKSHIFKTEKTNYLVFDICHIVSDATSVSVLLEEFCELYKGNNIENQCVQYSDFSKWQKDYFENGGIKKQQEYWENRYSKEISINPIPSDYSKKKKYSSKGVDYSVYINDSLKKKITELGVKTETSLYTILLAAYKLWLSKLTKSDDVVVAVPINGRKYPEIDKTIGLFMNTLLLNTNVSCEDTFLEFLDSVKTNTFDAFENQEYPLSDFVELLNKKGLFGENEYSELITVFNYLNIKNSDNSTNDLDFYRYKLDENTSLERTDLYSNTDAKYALSVFIYDVDDGLKIKCNYKEDYFCQETIEYLISEYMFLLKQIVEEADKQIKEYSVFDKSRIKNIVNIPTVKSIGEVSFEREEINGSIIDRFKKIVNQFGNRTAISKDGINVTYSELDQKSNGVSKEILDIYDDSTKLSYNERIRYSRQMMIEGWGIAGQEKLKGTKIFIAGAGGSASPIAYQMALCGIGTIIIADYDTVELSNLNRQFLHDETRIGNKKTESAKKTIRRINPNVNVIAIDKRITKENVDELIGDADVIFDNVDDLETKFILSECAVSKGIPHVLSSMIDMSSYSVILYPPYSPCFHCLYDRNKLNEIDELKKNIKDYKKTAAPVAAPSLFASTGFICNEILKMIVGNGIPAYNKYFFFNQNATTNFVNTTGYKAITYPFSDHFKRVCRKNGFDWELGWSGKTIEEIELERDPHCVICGGVEKEKSIKQKNKESYYTAIQSNAEIKTVALLMNHGVEMIEGMIGALKAGMIYVPMDPVYPIERLKFILEDSEARVILTDSQNEEKAIELINEVNENIKLINVESIMGIYEYNGIKTSSDSYAYILYTSGSTGKPKGVLQTHKNVLHFIQVYTNNLNISCNDKLTLFSSYCFDASVMDIYGALLNGATLLPFSINRQAGLEDIYSYILTNGITIYHSIPTVFRLLVSNCNDKTVFSNVRLAVMGGEETVKTDYELFKKYFPDNSIFINGLGPTESTVTLQYIMDKNSKVRRSSVPVGYPVYDTEVYILNSEGKIAQTYEVGEILYKSDYIAKGYWNRKKETDESFVIDPITGNGIVYKSGDYGRYLPDGTIEFSGRKDFQFKIRGYRIEISEIETELNLFKGIKQGVVVPGHSSDGKTELIGFYISDVELNNSDIKTYLKSKLPTYMVPNSLQRLERFPLTSSGKINRKQLSEIEIEKETVEFCGAENAIEEKITEIWEEVLKKQGIGVKDSFFDVGGTSLSLLQMQAQLAQLFDTKISITDLFSLQTIRNISRYIYNEKNLNEIELFEDIKISDEFLSASNEKIFVEYEYNCTRELDVLRKVSKIENVSIDSIVAALFYYTLSKRMVSEKIFGHVCACKYNTVEKATFDYSRAESISEMLHITENAIKTSTNQYDIEALESSMYSRADNAIYSIVVNYNNLNRVDYEKLMQFYGVIFDYSMDEENIHFKWIFDSLILPDESKRLVNEIIASIQMLEEAYS